MERTKNDKMAGSINMGRMKMTNWSVPQMRDGRNMKNWSVPQMRDRRNMTNWSVPQMRDGRNMKIGRSANAERMKYEKLVVPQMRNGRKVKIGRSHKYGKNEMR